MLDFETANLMGKATAINLGMAKHLDQLVTRDFDITLDLPNDPKKLHIGGYVVERIGLNVK